MATLYVGTYAAAGGGGLQCVDYDPEAGFTARGAYRDAANASFGVHGSRHGLHYLVDEQGIGMVGIHRHAANGWTRLAELSSEGREPCYVALSPDERSIAVANYGSGSVALIGLTADGLPSGEVALWANDGHGPNAERQEAPHVHCVRFSPDGRWLHAVDLGTDQLLRFEVGDAIRLEPPLTAWQAPPGSGPRHFLYHPTHPLALLVTELASTLILFDAAATAFEVRSEHSTLPRGFSGDSLGGHLELDRAGRRVYVTNRGYDSIVVFALDPDSGALDAIQHVASGGASPRHFLLLEDQQRLIVVNEEAGNVVAFAIDADGRLAPTGHSISIAGAAYIFSAD